VLDSNIIFLLPDTVCNQIAAGEVVQRPASVVKELLENSIDAGSTEIQLVIKNGGKSLIQVIDNGIGMSAIDARMSLEKHATSKIKSVEELYCVKTMGFRGEAIASIVSVSQSEIITKTKYSEIGTKIVVEGSSVLSQEEYNTHVGTNFIVKNLFFNLPARRVFLKTDEIELRHIMNEFQYVAISRPDIKFSFISDGEEKYNLKSTNLLNRIADLLGNIYKTKAIKCNENNPLVKIDGFIGDVSCAKKQKIQYLYVNNRHIKNQYLQNAIEKAYENLIPKDKNPFYVIFLTVNPGQIDVNIHPAKTEVKFHNEEFIYEFLKAHIRKTLTHFEYPKIDFDREDSIFLDDTFSGFQEVKNINKTQQDIIFKEGKNENENVKTNYEITETFKTSLMQVKPCFILSTVKSGILIINSHLAHIRILYEKFLQQFKNKKKQSQQLLFPFYLRIDINTCQKIKKNIEILKYCGFTIEFKNDEEIFITSCPINFNEDNIKNFFDDFEDANFSNEKLALKLAQNSSMTTFKILSNEEMQNLIDQLFSCEEQNYTPNGERIWTILKVEHIFELLK
jgi:DNA mismatch repair protein MutL